MKEEKKKKTEVVSECVGYLSFRCDYWFRRKLHVCCLQDGVLLQDVLLRLVVAEGLRAKRRTAAELVEKLKTYTFPYSGHQTWTKYMRNRNTGLIIKACN